MKLILFLFVAILGIGSGEAQTKERANETKNIQGTWRCVSATIDGKPLPAATAEQLRLTLTKTNYKTEKGAQTLFDSTYTVDASKKPKEIDMIGTEGDLAGKTAPGIFSVEGEILRICYALPGSPRPKAFESAEGSKAFLVSWKREK